MFDGKLEQILADQNPYRWILHLRGSRDYRIETMVAWDEEALTAAVSALECMDESRMIAPKDAYLSDYTEGQGYQVVPEENGTTLKREAVMTAVSGAVKNLCLLYTSTFVHGYMSNSGYEDVRTTVAESINRRFGTKFAMSNILMTVGAASGLNIILKTILNPGDEVITFAPYFVEYGSYVRNYDGCLVVISPNTETFQPNLDEFEKKITPKTKGVIINTPNNPTGVVYSAETLTRMADILRAKEKEYGTDIVLISDEPYRELAYDGVEVPYVTKFYDNTVVCYSYSKSLSLPGERIGYLVIPDELTDSAEVFNAATIANRVMGCVNAPSLMQRVIMRCIDEQVNLEAYDRNRNLLYNGLKDICLLYTSRCV